MSCFVHGQRNSNRKAPAVASEEAAAPAALDADTIENTAVETAANEADAVVKLQALARGGAPSLQAAVDAAAQQCVRVEPHESEDVGRGALVAVLAVPLRQ